MDHGANVNHRDEVHLFSPIFTIIIINSPKTAKIRIKGDIIQQHIDT